MKLPIPPFARALLATLACLAGPVPALCAEAAVLERIAASGVLRVGTTGDYRPYTDHDPVTGAWRGADIELARALAARLGVGVVFVQTSWPELMGDLAAGRFDIAIGGISITRERLAAADFSLPYARDGKTSLASCARLDSLDELRELDSGAVRVIVNPGGTNERFARQHLPRAKLVVHTDNRSVFDELLAGRADVMITDAVEAQLQAAQHPGVLCAAHPDRPFDQAEKAVLLPRDPALKVAVDEWLRAALARGEVSVARDVWLAHPWQASSVLLGLVDARLALMSDVARYKWNADAAIEDPVRERELLATLTTQGLALGVPAERTEAFFTAQFAAARRLQHDLFDLWRGQSREKLPPGPDLARVIRPELDRISNAMVAALASADLPRDTLLAGRAGLSTELLSSAAGRLALAPLVQGELSRPSAGRD